jgi:putative hydrolase of the HAD superfamily
MFDIYGTLFISGCGDIALSSTSPPSMSVLDEMLIHYGFKASPEELPSRLHQAILSEHRRKKADGLSKPEIDIVAAWQRVLDCSDADRARGFALEYEWAVNPCYPMPGLDHTLRVLRSRGLTMGLISNAQFYTPYLFQWFLGALPEDLGFDATLTVYSYCYGEAKPSEKLFNSCQATLNAKNITPSSVVYIGNDVLNDILPATSMAWQTVLFAGDRRSLRLRRDCPDCRAVRPDLVITDLRQLLEWI